ncbi:CPBP family intramembrane glutamic endopeptidase [Liquorilactobacillus oeni]|uniref:CAAX family protease n=1 Tax=Liquorilactobacillus oeni DSM 19972 TaxID=1423777 RepID=A0A0R1MG03_9LACO|nr:type II CAAX endopeptidase family protein [Liquorilactobacillus oeni]KRL04852.1 CAAX family protease [Liquorilactobacillus oeni DSM 19972]
MKVKENSLGLLSIYTFVMVIPGIIFSFFKNNTFLFYSTALLGFLGIVAMFILNNKFVYKNRFENQKKKSALTCFLWGIAGTAIVLLLQRLTLFFEISFLFQTPDSQNTAQALAIIRNYPFYLVYLLIAAPIMEEFIFRKVLFGNLSTFINPLGAALIASMLFSIAHADGHFLTYAVIGLAFCCLYAKTGRLLTSMTAHILMNTVIIILQFV